MGRNLFEYHPVLGHRFIPGIDVRVRHEGGGYKVKTNNLGFNCTHDVTVEKPSGCFRILLFGDSYTAGDGVSIGHRYGDLLEAQLGDVQVLNFGMPGSGTDQQFLAFKEFAEGLEYDLLIVSPMVENIKRILRSHSLTIQGTDGQVVKRAKPYFELVDGGLELRHVPVPKEVIPVDEAEVANVQGQRTPGKLKCVLKGLFEKHPELHAFIRRMRRIKFPPEYERADDPGWLLMKAILSEWIRRSRAPVLINPLPTFAHINQGFSATGYRRRFGELVAEAGSRGAHVEVTDILSEFLKLDRAERQRCRFPVDEHPTKLGHEVIARGLAPYVQRDCRPREVASHAGKE